MSGKKTAPAKRRNTLFSLKRGKKPVTELKKDMAKRLRAETFIRSLPRKPFFWIILAILLSGGFFAASVAARSAMVIVSGLPSGEAERAEFERFALRFQAEGGPRLVLLDLKGGMSSGGKKLRFPPILRRPDIVFLPINRQALGALSSGAYRDIEGAISLMGPSWQPAPALLSFIAPSGTPSFIPARIDPWVLFASPSLLEKARVKAPTALDDFSTASTRLLAAHQLPAFRGLKRLPADPTAFSPLVLGGGSADGLLAWPALIACAAGGQAFSAAWTSGMPGDALMEAIDRLRPLADAALFHPVSASSGLTEARDILSAGKSAWGILPLSAVDNLPTAARGDLRPATLPQGSSTDRPLQALMASVDAWAIAARAANPRGAERVLAAAWTSKELRFLAYASAKLPGNTRAPARNEEAQAQRDAVNWADAIILPPSAVLDGSAAESASALMRALLIGAGQ